MHAARYAGSTCAWIPGRERWGSCCRNGSGRRVKFGVCGGMSIGCPARRRHCESKGRWISPRAPQKAPFDPALNAQRLLRLSEVSTMIGLGRSSIYRYVSEGRFPAPVNVGDRSVRWKLADVLAWRAHISDAGAVAEEKESGRLGREAPEDQAK